MQFADDLQVSGEHAQFGGGAQFQFAAFIDVEGLVGIVGLHAHPRAIRRQFEQGEAVAHLRRAGGREQALAEQAHAAREDRVGQLLEVVGGLSLQLGLQGAGGRKVQAVEVVQRPVKQGGDAAAGHADAFVGIDGLERRLLLPVTIRDVRGEGRVEQCRVDHRALPQQAQMAVGELGKLRATIGQVMRRAALGDHQRQHLTQGQATLRQVGRIRFAAAQGLIDLLEVGAVPHAQPLSQAMHFTMPGHGGQRHAVEVVAHDVLARDQRVRPGLISPHAGGKHLAQLLAAGQGQAVGRVPVFFQLGRQRTAAGTLAGQVQYPRGL